MRDVTFSDALIMGFGFITAFNLVKIGSMLIVMCGGLLWSIVSLPSRLIQERQERKEEAAYRAKWDAHAKAQGFASGDVHRKFLDKIKYTVAYVRPEDILSDQEYQRPKADWSAH